MNATYDNSIHALSGAYAVDALDGAERVQFEQHLAGCADCRAEVDSLVAAAGTLAELTATPPPPEVRDRVLAGIAAVRPLPPLDATDEAAPEAQEPAQQPVEPPTGQPDELAARRSRRTPLLAVAAALLAVLGAGAVVTHPWDTGTSHVQLSAADQVLHARDARSFTATAGLPPGAKATVTRSVSLGRAVIVTTGMPPAPKGKVYELWLQNPRGNMTPAGLMTGTDATTLLTGDAATATAAAITAEPAGGSPQPTSAPLALFDFKAKA